MVLQEASEHTKPPFPLFAVYKIPNTIFISFPPIKQGFR